jgi:hypothetical protein
VVALGGEDGIEVDRGDPEIGQVVEVLLYAFEVAAIEGRRSEPRINLLTLWSLDYGGNRLFSII